MYRLQEQQNEIVLRCVKAEPRHGEAWCSVSKNVDNWRLRTEEVLKAAAAKLDIPT